MRSLIARSLADAELAEAIEWYATRSPAAARRFLSCIDATIEWIVREVNTFPLVDGTVRRALVPHFPHGVYVIVLPTAIHVVGVVHNRRHPQRWLRRDAP